MTLTLYIMMKFWSGAGPSSGGGGSGGLIRQSTKFHSNMATMMNRKA